MTRWRSLPRTKFGNQVVKKEDSFDGRFYHSLGEHRRSIELSLLEKTGAIERLDRQVRFHLVVDGVDICDYIADFTYIENGRMVVEDFKGAETAEFRIKWALMRALYPELELRLTRAQTKTFRRRGRASRKRPSPLARGAKSPKRRSATP